MILEVLLASYDFVRDELRELVELQGDPQVTRRVRHMALGNLVHVIRISVKNFADTDSWQVCNFVEEQHFEEVEFQGLVFHIEIESHFLFVNVLLYRKHVCLIFVISLAFVIVLNF